MIEDVTAEHDDQSSEGDALVEVESIKITGVGHLTLFGLSNKFDTEFPSALTGKLAPEEYEATLCRLNKVLGRSLPTNLRWLFCGCLCCCCTLGLSIWPVVFLNKRTRHLLEKIIDSENRNRYHKLSLHLKLSKQMMSSGNMMEYVLIIESRPKLNLLKPD